MGQTHLIAKTLLMVTIIGSFSNVSAQDVDGVLSLIEQGKTDSAKAILANMSYQYPGNPGVKYATAIVQDDALLAAGIYKDIARNHAGSKYAPSSYMHLGEYYYAQGLYIQSRQFFSRLINNFPKYPDLVNAVNLTLRAGIASRQMDSVYTDLAYIVEKFPNVAFDIPEELDLTRIPGQRDQFKQSDAAPDPLVAPTRKLGQDLVPTEHEALGQYSLQAGAFGNYDNAKRLSDQIESIGYSTRIKERDNNGKTLYLIMVGDYASKTAAMSVADMLDAALGIPSFPVANR